MQQKKETFHCTPDVIEALSGNAADAILDWSASKPSIGDAAYILAGSGPNAELALGIARILAAHRRQVLLFSPEDAVTGRFKQGVPSGTPISSEAAFREHLSANARLTPLIVDCVSGIDGASNAPGICPEGFRLYLNSLFLPTVAVGAPAGLMEGASAVLRADMTLVFGRPHPLCLTQLGLERCGSMRCIETPLSEHLVHPENMPETFIQADARALLRPRSPFAHKYTVGSVLILAGSRRYNGAPFLAAEGALRAGAGLVRLLLPEAARKRPGPAALIVQELEGAEHFRAEHIRIVDAAAEKADALLCGPGISPEASPEIIRHLLCLDKPLVLDADALNLLAAHPDIMPDDRKASLTLTPHLGELGRLAAAFLPNGAGIPPEEQAGRLAASE